MNHSTSLLLATGLLVASVMPATARAAESYDNCTGFIDSLPATITTQGTWCLRKDLAYAIAAGGDVIDDTVDGVFANGPDTFVWGVLVGQMGGEARGNRIRGLVVAGVGTAMALYATNEGVTFADNRIHSQTLVPGRGISGHGMTFCTGNTIMNYGTPIQSCTDAGGNTSR